MIRTDINQISSQHMVITDRLLAPVAIQGKGNRVVNIDVSALTSRLLLFGTYILQSVQLDELPFLTRLFGERGLIRLFEVGALGILFESYTLAQLGQARADLRLTGNSKRLPFGSYSFSPVRLQDQETVAEQKLHQLSKPLAAAVRANLIAMPDNFSARVFDGFYSDLRGNSRVVENSIRHELQKLGIKPKNLKILISETDDEDFRTESNLRSEYCLSDEDSHRVVERALLAIGDLNLRLVAMATYHALTGVNDSDKFLLEGKFEALADLVDSADHQGRFSRVKEIAGLHASETNVTDVDAERIIRIRDSEECRAFRDWLRTVDSRSDAELRERLIGLNSRIREALNSRPGKVLRFLVSNGLSLAASPVGALAVSAVDSIVIDQLARKDAIVSFLSESYPSIFRRGKS
ncbi:MAG: hypothetical protein WBE20_01470 [Candidatus Acidiferrales bacterium]